MNRDEDTGAGDDPVRSQQKRFGLAVLLTFVVIAVDILVFMYVVPWAQEAVDSPIISPGYILAFFVILCNFVALVGIVAYVLHGESYPSDRWR